MKIVAEVPWKVLEIYRTGREESAGRTLSPWTTCSSTTKPLHFTPLRKWKAVDLQPPSSFSCPLLSADGPVSRPPPSLGRPLRDAGTDISFTVPAVFVKLPSALSRTPFPWDPSAAVSSEQAARRSVCSPQTLLFTTGHAPFLHSSTITKLVLHHSLRMWEFLPLGLRKNPTLSQI